MNLLFLLLVCGTSQSKALLLVPQQNRYYDSSNTKKIAAVRLSAIEENNYFVTSTKLYAASTSVVTSDPSRNSNNINSSNYNSTINNLILERRRKQSKRGVAHHLYNTYAGDPNVRDDIVEGPWQWRSEQELAEKGMFRGSYRPYENEVGILEDGRLAQGFLQSNETGTYVRDDENFAMRYNELKKFKREFGHCNVPMLHQGTRSDTNYLHYPDYFEFKNETGSRTPVYRFERLANWCHMQRLEYGIYQIDRKYSFLTPYRVRNLEEIGFEWNVLQQRWLEQFERLKEFRRKYGHCRVPISYEDKSLVSWVHQQREAYRKFNQQETNDGSITSCMTLQRIELLDSVSFTWNVYDEAWNNMFARLLTYKERYGNTNVPRGYEEDVELSYWVAKQRALYSKLQTGDKQQTGDLTKERIKLLEGEGFIWAILEHTWENWIEQLLQYKESHGDCAIPSTYEENQEFANWARYQRQEFVLLKAGKKSSLTESRVAQLSDIGFEWNLVEFKWLRRFDELVAYKDRHGDCNVPSSYKENPELAFWVKTQRRQHSLLQQRRHSTMSKERIEKLQNIGFDFDPPPEKTSIWDKRLEELIAYKAEHGNYNIPQSYTEVKGLFNWLKFQKQEYRRKLRGEKSSMTDDRLQKLQAIDFDFFSPEERPFILSAMIKGKRVR